MDVDLESAVLEALPLAILVVREDGAIVRANGRAAALAGRGVDPLAGAAIGSALARMRCGTPLPDAVREAASGGGSPVRTIEAAWIDPDSRAERPMRLRIGPIAAEGGGLALIAIDELDDVRGPVSLAGVLRRIAEIRHDMNNPLMAILGSAELVLEREDLPPEVRARVTSIFGEARRLGDRVADLAKVGDEP